MMKTTRNWLREVCPVDAPAREIARLLTMSGLEVEQV
jgi:hypothetical protein